MDAAHTFFGSQPGSKMTGFNIEGIQMVRISHRLESVDRGEASAHEALQHTLGSLQPQNKLI